MAYYLLSAKSIVVHKLGKLLLSITCIIWAHFPVCTSGGTVRLDVPSETWEGEGALMRCTFTGMTVSDFVYLLWFKGSLSGPVYGYITSSKKGEASNSWKHKNVVGQLVDNVHQLYINKTVLTDEDTYKCTIRPDEDSKKLTVNVRPTGMSLTGLDQWVKENTQVEVVCKVDRVKPQASLYWRKGDRGRLTKTTPVVTDSGGVFQLVSTFTVSFMKTDHNTKLYCLVTRPGDSGTVWATVNETVKVSYVPITEVTCSENPTEGRTVILTCEVTDGRPRDVSEVTWKKDNKPLSSAGTTLTISSADYSMHDGLYSCAAKNVAGTGDPSATFHLQMNYVPSTEVTCSENPTEGRTVTLTCEVTDGRPRDVSKVTWKKDNKPLSSTGTTLTISSADHNTHDGLYSCTAKNVAGTGDPSATFHLQINYVPSTEVTCSENPTEGRTVTLTCEVTDGRPRDVSEVTWTKDNKPLSSTGTTLTISSADHSMHDGLYSCAAKNVAGTGDPSATFHLQMNYPPSTRVSQKGSVNPTDGSSVTLTCTVIDGRPLNVITKMIWKKGDTIFTPSSRYKLSDSDKELTINPLDHSQDDAYFSCAAENAAGRGSYSATFQLLVHYKPTVSVLTSVPVVEGQPVTITCQSQGARPAVTSVKWKKGQEVITVTTDTKYTGGTAQNPSLTIRQTTRTDAGLYTCQLSNSVGQDTGTVTLQVWYKPYGQPAVKPEAITVAVGRQVSLTCRAPTESGNPATSWFTWHKQNSDFSKNTTTGVLSLTPSRVDESGKFNCVAGNWIGQSDYSDWATVTVQAPAKVEYPRIDNIPWTPAFDDQDFNMTCTVSGSGDVKIAWLKDGVSLDTGDFTVTTVQVTDRHYMYGQTDAKKSTLKWRVTKGARYFTCGNITHFDGHYICAGTTETAGAMTHDVSKAFIVNVQYEAHWSSGRNPTAAAPNETSKDIVCSVCANPQPNFRWTFNNEILRDGISVAGDTITLDVVRTEDFGSYTCSVNNEVNGEERSKIFHIDLVETGPARAPLEFSVLHNHTSVALTLQWRPGFDGGYPPQTFTLQYKAPNEVALRTWSNIFNYTTDAMTWYHTTVTGLQPQTQYVFSLYAENSRPRDKGPNRSLTVTETGSTTASPEVTIQGVKVETDKMTVTWSYKGQSLRRKRSTSTNVSVVIYYQPDGGEEAHYPLEGSVAAEERQVTINGQFDDKVKYKVWLKVFEGQLVVLSQQRNSFETTALSVEKRKEVDANNSTIVIATASAGVGMLVIGLIVGLVIGIVCMRRRRQSAKKDDVAEMSGPGTKHSPVQKDKDVISTTELSGDSIQYESLNEGHSNEVSAQQGTYAGIDTSGETIGQTTYEYIGADGPQKLHTYINTAVVGDDDAEYSEVKETVAAEATRGQPTYQNISTKNTAN